MGVSQAIAADPLKHYKGPLLEAGLMWDAGWYVSVAKDGYSIPPAPELSNVAFAPLLPALVKGLGEVFGALGLNMGDPGFGHWTLAGLLLTNAAFFAALYILWQLLARDHPASVANRTLWLIAGFPLGVFWSAIYTEALFLLLAASCILLARRGMWPLAGLLGGLAALTRWAGILLACVLLIEWLDARGMLPRGGRSPLALSSPRFAPWHSALWIGLVPLALGSYMLYLWSAFGSPWVVSQVMAERWQHKMSFFIDTYVKSVDLLWQSVTQTGPARLQVLELGQGNSLYMWLDLGLPLLFVYLGVIGWRRGWLRYGDLAWLALGLLFPLSADNTRSLARYLMPLWPAMLVVSRLCDRWPTLERVWITVSVGLMALGAFIYGSGRWIG